MTEADSALLISLIGFFNTGGRIVSGAVTDHPRVDALFVTTLALFFGRDVHSKIWKFRIILRRHMPCFDDLLLQLLVIHHRLHPIRSLSVSLASCDVFYAGQFLQWCSYEYKLDCNANVY